MTRPERRKLKREMAQALHNIDRCLGNIQWLHERFEPSHPEYAQLLEAIAQTAIVSKHLMIGFWDKAWGPIPDDYNTYRE